MIRRAIAAGVEPVHAVRMATLSTARYFGLGRLGGVAPGKIANITVLEDLTECRVSRVYHAGTLVAERGEAIDVHAKRRRPQVLRSSVNVRWLEPDDFVIEAPRADAVRVHVIEVLEDRIDTHRSIETLTPVAGRLVSDPERDILKIAVVERHAASGQTGLAFVKGFGLRQGAIASSVGHDSHNLVVVGTRDEDIFAAAVHLVKIRGGFCVVRDGEAIADVPLPIAGLMSDTDAPSLSAQLQRLHEAAHSIGSTLRRPFMALSFLTLSVIGSLKLTDQGLIDVDRFERIDLIASP